MTKASVTGADRITRAFRRSLWVLAGLGVLVTGALVVRHLLQPAPPPPVEQAQVDLASLMARPEVPDPPRGRFVDITEAAGIDFVHANGAFGERLLPETMGGGVAFLDYNRDGHQDLLFVDSGAWPFAPDAAIAGPTLRLYANDGQGRFREVTEAAGLAGHSFYGMGLAVADVTGNGYPDLFVTAVGPNRFFVNRGGRFEEATERAGVAGEADRWSTSAAFFDADGDGDLDLFVANYVEWSRQIDIEVDYRLTGIGRAYGPPTNFQGVQSYLYFNNGDGSFRDVSAEAGIHVNHPATGEPEGKALAVVPVDLNDDGRLDLVVANDTVRNFAFVNQGDGLFVEQAAELGLGFDRNGLATGAMGIDAVRFESEGNLAIAIGNFANEMSSFYVGRVGRGGFADQSIGAGIGAATRLALTFGVFFFDYDLDGRLDYLQANGHVENDINRVQSSQRYRQPGQLFWNCGAVCPQTLQPLDRDRIGDLARPMVGRGAAYADIDGNGRLDVILTQVAGPPLLLRNNTGAEHHWLRVRLEGQPPNTDAIGARIRLEADDLVQTRRVMPSRSYLSQVELPVTFGLGPRDRVDRLVVTWPDGEEQVIDDPAVDRLHVIAREP
ncbi:CRTAC1 family protein [Wenzhouxiangella limi]|uniref:CRTAC1 family protein n=1 Tax=Wenzhouxiangella limi TaxID=2707351 RepID=A0A845UV89_9GAMM|nr:CRTAC1 family protein [Wenzhouxiangella limi]NDY95753.1 CRTAC1 family protein [Wenzhouxiangella limi]